jgi:uncharacterized protein (TIRG00374 family)
MTPTHTISPPTVATDATSSSPQPGTNRQPTGRPHRHGDTEKGAAMTILTGPTLTSPPEVGPPLGEEPDVVHPEAAPVSGSERSVLRPLLRFGLGLAATALLYRFVRDGWPEIRDAVRVLVTGQRHLLIAVAVLEVLWTVALSRLLVSAVRAVGGGVRGVDALRISMAGFTLSRVVPGGGAAGGIFATREIVLLGNPLSTALGAMVVSWTVATSVLATLVLAGTTVASLTDDVPLVYLVPSVTVLGVLVAVGLLVTWMVNDRGARVRILGAAGRVSAGTDLGPRVAALSASLDDVAEGLRSRRHLVTAAGWSMLAWASDAAALWLVFAAFGYRLSLTQLVLGYSFANLLNSAPELTPGWIGVFETAMTTTYTALGVPAGIALVGVVSYRVVSFWLPVAAGAPPALSSLARSRRSTSDETLQEVPA